MRARLGSIRLLWILAVLATYSCGTEKAPPAPEEPPLDLNEQTQKGWNLFRQHSYSPAGSVFRQLIALFPDAPDPYIGLGWCNVEQDSLLQALSLFEHALTLDEQDDALAGLVVTASALAQDSLAVEAAYRTTNTGYIFNGNPLFG